MARDQHLSENHVDADVVGWRTNARLLEHRLPRLKGSGELLEVDAEPLVTPFGAPLWRLLVTYAKPNLVHARTFGPATERLLDWARLATGQRVPRPTVGAGPVTLHRRPAGSIR